MGLHFYESELLLILVCHIVSGNKVMKIPVAINTAWYQSKLYQFKPVPIVW